LNLNVRFSSSNTIIGRGLFVKILKLHKFKSKNYDKEYFYPKSLEKLQNKSYVKS